VGARHQVGCWEDFFDEAEAEGFCGVDNGGGEHQAEGLAAADEAGEALGSAIARDEAEFDFGKAEAGFVAGEAEGAGEGELATAAEGDSVEAGDDGFAAALDLGEDLLAALRDGEAGGGVGGDEAADVGSGGEGTVSGAGEQDDADGGVGGEGGEGLFEVVEHGGVEGVQDVGAVEGDGGDGVGAFEVEGGCFWHLGTFGGFAWRRQGKRIAKRGGESFEFPTHTLVVVGTPRSPSARDRGHPVLW